MSEHGRGKKRKEGEEVGGVERELGEGDLWGE
jgi:hypothetical protein